MESAEERTNANHRVFPRQVSTLTFAIPNRTGAKADSPGSPGDRWSRRGAAVRPPVPPFQQ